MCTLLHPHDTCVWGDIPRGLGTIVVTFKPSGEACQTGSECINHPHHIPHSRITISTSWWLNSPSPLVVSWSTWPLISCILQCSKFMTIRSGVSLKSTVMANMVCSRTSLWSWKRCLSSFRIYHRLVLGLIQHPSVSHNLLLFNLCLLHSRGNYNWFFGLHKLHFFGDFIAKLLSPNVINFVSEPVSVCLVERNISVPAYFGVPFQGVSGFLKYIYVYEHTRIQPIIYNLLCKYCENVINIIIF